jgi:6-phosphogluconolactonase
MSGRRSTFLSAQTIVLLLSTTAAADTVRVYLGTYTRGESRGIYLTSLDRETGQLAPPELAGECEQPSFVALHPRRPLLYAVSEVAESDGGKGGAVTAFAVDRSTGLLTRLNHQTSGGAGPCHLVVDPSGRNVLVANYGGGSIAALPIAEDGSLAPPSCFIQHEGSSVNPRRQEGPHAHSINLDASGRFAVVCDLGLDKVLVYEFDADTGTLSPGEPPSTSVAGGSGPRHFAFHPSGRFAYANLEISSEVRAFRYHGPYGVLYGFQSISTLPEDFEASNSTAETQVHPSGRFVYCSNRGHDSIAVFAVDEQSGALTLVEHEPTHGETPRNFGIDPTGQYLLAANQKTDNVVSFRIDRRTGELSPTGSSIRVPSPVCVKFSVLPGERVPASR